MSWRDVGPADLEVGSARQVEVQGKLLAIVRDQLGEWYAVDDTCTHADVSLSEGEVGEGTIECWGHCAQFDLKTGEGEMPAPMPVGTYTLKTEGGRVLVDI